MTTEEERQERFEELNRMLAELRETVTGTAQRQEEEPVDYRGVLESLKETNRKSAESQITLDEMARRQEKMLAEMREDAKKRNRPDDEDLEGGVGVPSPRPSPVDGRGGGLGALT